MDERTAAIYRRFGELEHQASPRLLRLALAVASHAEVVDLIAGLPLPKRQANLVFRRGGVPRSPLGPYSAFRAGLCAVGRRFAPWSRRRHSTQPTRRALVSLLPVLSRGWRAAGPDRGGRLGGTVPPPERNSYRYRVDGAGTVSLDPAEGPSPVALPCTIDQGSVSKRLPEVVWRAGVDLHPIDPSDPEVWPGRVR